MNRTPIPKPWNKVSRGYLTKIYASLPGPGVWISATRGDKNLQHTIEMIALNGQIIATLDCFCGADRHKAWAKARDLSTSLSRRPKPPKEATR